ncbi:epsilon-sarcoglycan-like isoform X2 [Strongylocentrotus purpuratus]|uniref:Dystroglycan-type cadherin-like domain-containing protein n=1 Tax=Strongylocentrotus purpuratus TaxID=7668 RepID=A0A7M7N2A1_STRPU|nr:epsilon-sarcoglycan-like isoform X2 [Strongylocentrotus purpuratus]
MEVKTSSYFIGIFLAVLHPHLIQALTILSGVNFQHPILRTDYFDEYTLDSTDPIIFRPSLVSKPSLPSWLKFIQPADRSDGYLYGTPQGSNIGQFNLEIIGLNSRTYESARKLVPMTVEENTGSSSKYQADFFITNLNLADILDTEKQDDFRSGVNAFWGQGSQVTIQSLTSAQDLGLRVPLNPQPDQKYGVRITIGARQESETLAKVISDAVGPCQQDSTYTPTDINGFFQPAFTIDWCNVSMMEVSPTQLQNESTPVFLGGMYEPPIMQVEDSDRFLEFLLLVVVPCAIMFCSILVLGYLMCCGRSGRKEVASTSELQLTHHRTLRQACRDLRTMSNRRDGTASVATLTPIGTPTVGSQRSHSRSRGYDEYPWASSTPQVNHRGMATPPPYRTPPHPHKHRETSFSNQASDKRRLSEPSNARGGESPSMRPVPPFMGSTTSDRVRPRHV